MNPTTPLPPGVPAARFVDPEHVAWRVAVGYENPGAEEKILYEDATGTYVRLLRWPAGFVTGSEPLRHDEFDEFAWLLEGASVSLGSGERYEAGRFCVVPCGTLHGPFEAPEGALLLEMRQPIAVAATPGGES